MTNYLHKCAIWINITHFANEEQNFVSLPIFTRPVFKWVVHLPLYVVPQHSTLSKNLIKNWIPLTGPLLGGRALLGGPEYGLVEILQNGACQKKIKNHFIPQFSELSKNSLYSYPQFSEISKNSLYSCTELCTMVAKSLEKNLVTIIRFQILTSS